MPQTEYHCLLIKCSVLEELGPFDEQLKTIFDHNDFSLQLMERGDRIVMDPNVVVSYSPPTPLLPSDREFMETRWSAENIQASLSGSVKSGISPPQIPI